MSAVFKKIIRDYKLSTRLVPVFTLAPELELACSRVAEFVGERFMGAQEPLVKEMLTSALAGFKRVRKTGDSHIAFMQGLFEHAHLFEPVPVFEARYAELETGMVDERCPEHITQRSAAMQLAARALTGENFRMYFEDYDVAHCFSDNEADAG